MGGAGAKWLRSLTLAAGGKGRRWTTAVGVLQLQVGSTTRSWGSVGRSQETMTQQKIVRAREPSEWGGQTENVNRVCV